MDRENPFRGSAYPMSNPNSPAPAEPDSDGDQFLAYAAAAAESHRSNTNTPRYAAADVYNAHRGDDYNAPQVYEYPLADQLARLTLEAAAAPPLFQFDDVLQRLRIQSAAARSQNYQNFNFENFENFENYARNNGNGLLLFNGANPQNYQNNGDGLLFFNGANLYNSGDATAAAAAAVNYSPSRRLNGDTALNFYNSRRLNGVNPLNYERQRLNGLLNQYEIENFNSRLSSVSRRQQQQRPNLVPLHEMRGKIVTVAKDQFGCRFLQNKFAEGNPDEIQMIFTEIKDHIYELIVHQFGNYLISKFVEVCNQEQMNQLLMLVVNDDRKFADICADMYGTRVVQKLLEHLTTQEQRCRVISVLRRITVSLTKTMNGHHVLQYCLKFFSIDDNKHILNVVADNCLDIATDKSGCCVLQQCLEHALGEPRQRLIAKLTSNALQLSHHPFGNYVVQYILGLNIGYATTDILRQLSGNFVFLCMDKYGSNVVEKCLKEAEDNQKIPIIEEIIYSPNFLEVLQDPYGNYVAQRALNTCKGALLHALIEMINRNSPNLHSHPHGKRVLEKTTKNYKQTFG